MLNRVLAFIMLILLSPLFLVIAVAIKLDSPGPVIFRQKRVGHRGKYFTIYKFRTMVVDMPDLPADRVAGNDSRITRVGQVLRRLSLDELPQLWNIIKGDMDFIGPRPALYNQDDLIALREKAGVHSLKPGITGWAQVNGRETVSVEEKVQLDRYYLENRSLKLDLTILYLTFFKSLKGADIYVQQPGSQKGRRLSG